MACKLSDLESALLFVSEAMDGDSEVIVDKETGELFYRSELSDIDEFPEDADENDSDKYISVPNLNDLDLGRDLVFRFVESELPLHSDKVYQFFRSKGAYARFKAFLDEIGMLQTWYTYEHAQTKQAVLQWCEENGLAVELDNQPQ
jgi:hypothetical protein